MNTYFTFSKNSFKNFTKGKEVNPLTTLVVVSGEDGSKNRKTIRDSSIYGTYSNSFDRKGNMGDQEIDRVGFKIYTISEIESAIGFKIATE